MALVVPKARRPHALAHEGIAWQSAVIWGSLAIVLVGADPSWAQCYGFARFSPVVIRDNGSSTTVLEFRPTNPVASVRLELLAGLPLRVGERSACTGPLTVPLLDDGRGGDRVAGDGVFSIGGLRWDTRFPGGCMNPPTFSLRTSEIPGVRILRLQSIVVDPAPSGFSALPQVYVLDERSFGPLDEVVQFSSVMQATTSVVNIRDDDLRVDGFLGQAPAPSDLSPISRMVYASLPDAYDFVTMVSTTQFQCRSRAVGRHEIVQTKWTGTGQPSIDTSADYGSDGRLLGINGIEALGYSSYGLISHETVHQWAAYVGSNLGISDGVHWRRETSVGGLEGGCAWLDNGDGTFTSGGTWDDRRVAPELELYLMGLVAPESVAPIRIATNSNQDFCAPGSIIRGPFRLVTIEQIVAAHGARVPGVPDTQKDFAMVYVVTSAQRLLTATEMTLFGRAAKLISGEIDAIPESPDVIPGATFQELTGAPMETRLRLPLVRARCSHTRICPMEATASIPGDVDCDGVVRDSELESAIMSLFCDLCAGCTGGDVNRDSRVTAADVVAFRALVGPPRLQASSSWLLQ